VQDLVDQPSQDGGFLGVFWLCCRSDFETKEEKGNKERFEPFHEGIFSPDAAELVDPADELERSKLCGITPQASKPGSGLNQYTGHKPDYISCEYIARPV